MSSNASTARVGAQRGTRHPIIGGRASPSRDERPVPDRHNDAPFGAVSFAGAGAIENAIAAAHDARAACTALSARRREEILRDMASAVGEREIEFADTLAREAGKVISDARTEVRRCVETLTLSAEAARGFPASHGRSIETGDPDTALSWERVPVGPCAFITPFNFPLNLVAHKIGPAVAAGNPFVLKPADKAPLSAYLLVETLLEAGFPPGGVSCLVADPDALDPLAADPRIRFVSFTGSDRVGWAIRERARGKRVALELGGDAACILDEHLTDSQLDHACARLACGAFGYAGQSCISTQRVILHEQIADAALERFVERTKALVHADPFDPDAFVSPLIDAEAADRIERWIGDAVDYGAAVRTGGGRAGNVIEPTVLTGVSRETPLGCEEAFGPVAVVSTEGSLDAAIASANRTRYGIHAGVFSNDAASLRRACEGLDVAGVAINDVPTLRLDAEPYGGIRESGVGREGPAFALAEMTEIKSFTTKTLPG